MNSGGTYPYPVVKLKVCVGLIVDVLAVSSYLDGCGP